MQPNEQLEGWAAPKPDSIPPPTYWPAVLALGTTVIAMGLVMVWPVIVVGLGLSAIALGGWIGALTRHEQ